MKVIITHRFRSQYYKKFKKHFTLDSFAQVLMTKSHTLIDLTFPFFKHKGVVNGVHIRSVVLFRRGDNIIPLILSLKKTKISAIISTG